MDADIAGVLAHAKNLMDQSAKSNEQLNAVYCANEAIVVLLGALLEEIAALRSDLAKRA